MMNGDMKDMTGKKAAAKKPVMQKKSVLIFQKKKPAPTAKAKAYLKRVGM